MPSTKTQPARGMRDFLPEDVRKREYVIGVIKDVYQRYGFEPLETPAAENIETLMGKYGEEGNQLIFKILKRGVHEGTGEADLALRYDLTVPLARVVAEYRDKLPKFFKRYQIQPVWRADRPARGRFREFYQCDVDVLGSTSMVVEAEICAAASEVLVKLGFVDFNIRLNHRKVLTGILGVAGVALEKHDAALVALDKLDKVGRDGVEKELSARGIDEGVGKRLLEFFTELGALERAAEIVAGEDVDKKQSALNKAVLGRIVEFVGNNEMGATGVTELQAILDFGEAAGIATRIQIDPSLARGLSYYTGAIMEISVKDLAGSLGGGGRYDNLVGMFGGQDIPACGFSLGLERILVVMGERGMFPSNLSASPADVMVAVWNEESFSDSVKLAQVLRAGGLRVDLYPEADKLGKQFKYASSRAIPFVVVVGDEERARGEVAIKDLRSGEQRSVSRNEVGKVMRENLSGRV
ncbi:MAG TPA: histidine--tRNA ligase [Pyrinomonadaceae bacterium]